MTSQNLFHHTVAFRIPCLLVVDCSALSSFQRQQRCFRWNRKQCCGRAILVGVWFRFLLLSYLRSGSGSGSSHKFKEIIKFKFLSLGLLLKLQGNRLILTLSCLIRFPTLIPLKIDVSHPFWRPFYTRNWSLNLNRNLEQDHGSGSGSDRGKIIWFRQFRFRFRLRLRITDRKKPIAALSDF